MKLGKYIKNWVDTKLCRWFEYKDIEKEEGLYLRRWFLDSPTQGAPRWVRKLAARYGDHRYLHRILRSDNDRDPHNHPWDFTTRVMWSGYYDETWMCGAWWCFPAVYWSKSLSTHTRWLRQYERYAEHAHRVRLYTDAQGNEKEAWTLVTRGKYRRHWEFMTANGPVVWREYLNYWGPDSLDRIEGLDDPRIANPIPGATSRTRRPT